TQWMQALSAAQQDARATGTWIELIPGASLQWIRWRWNDRTNEWNHTNWNPPQVFSEDAAKVQLKTPFSGRHLWVAPMQGAIPFVQGVCWSAQCVMLAPDGGRMKGEISDISDSAL